MPGGKKIEKSKQPAEKYESQFSKYKIGPEGKNNESFVLILKLNCVQIPLFNDY